MTSVYLLSVLVVLDCALAGFRAAAGRSGRLDKRAYYNRAMLRGLVIGLALVGVFAGLVQVMGAWSTGIAAAATLVWIYGTFATAVLVAFAFYFAPVGCYRVLTSVIVFGPLTLVRRAVIVSGLVTVAVLHRAEARVVVLAALAAVAMLAVEPWLARRYGSQWRELIGPENDEGPGGNPDLRSSVTN